MKRRPKGKHADKKEAIPWVSSETKRSIAAILLIVLASFLLLAAAEKGGPAGAFTYRAAEKLFGFGYYLLPLIALAVAGLFLFSREHILLKATLAGAILFILF